MNTPPTELQNHIDRGLYALRALGFKFVTKQDPAGRIVALSGSRSHHGVIDIVQLYGEHDADAARIPGDEPDIMFPRRTIWRITGPAAEVIDRVLTLADPVTRDWARDSPERITA